MPKTTPERHARIDRERFESFESAIADTYASGEGPREEPRPRRRPLLTAVLASCALVLIVFAARRLSSAPVVANETPVVTPPSVVALRAAVVATRAAITPAPATPSPAPTASPIPTSAPSPTATPSPLATPAISIRQAPSLVQTNRAMTVGKKGSCGGDDATIDVRGFTRGCTFFGLASGGALANGKGAVVVVPVSTTEDYHDVAYALVYGQSESAGSPRFLGLLRGDGSRPLAIRFERGRIVAQSPGRRTYFTFDDRRVVRLAS